MHELIATTSTNSLQLPIDVISPSGHRAEFHIDAVLINGNIPFEQKRNDPELREFIIRAKLNKNYSHDTYKISAFENTDGSSFLTFPGAKFVEISSNRLKYNIFTNEHNELSVIEYKCRSNKSEAAIISFYENAMPQLNHLSYKYKVPIYIDIIHCVDTKHNIQHIISTNSYPKHIVPSHQVAIDIKLAPIYSIYREALNTSSCFYKFLCYYKIIEGMYGKIKPEFAKIIKKESISIEKLEDILPDDKFLSIEYKHFIGRSIKFIFDTALTKNYRNKIAHFVHKHNNPIDFSKIQINVEYDDVAYLSKICCDVLISNHEKRLQDYNEKTKDAQSI